MPHEYSKIPWLANFGSGIIVQVLIGIVHMLINKV